MQRMFPPYVCRARKIFTPIRRPNWCSPRLISHCDAQVVMTGNQEPKSVDITQAAIDAGAEVGVLSLLGGLICRWKFRESYFLFTLRQIHNARPQFHKFSPSATLLWILPFRSSRGG